MNITDQQVIPGWNAPIRIRRPLSSAIAIRTSRIERKKSSGRKAKKVIKKHR